MDLYLFVYSDLNGDNGVVMRGIEKHKKKKYIICTFLTFTHSFIPIHANVP